MNVTIKADRYKSCLMAFSPMTPLARGLDQEQNLNQDQNRSITGLFKLMFPNINSTDDLGAFSLKQNGSAARPVITTCVDLIGYSGWKA